MGPVTFIALLAALLTGAANVESQRRVIGREPPSTDGWRPVPGSTEQPRYSTQAVGHPVLDKLRVHLEDAERRKQATTPTPSVLASFSAVGPRRDQNAGFSGRLVPPPRDQPPPATFPQDSRGHSQDLSPASQTHPGPYYLHSLLPPPRASDFLLEGPGAPATSYVSFPPFSGDAYFGGTKQQATAQQLQFFPQQPQAQAQQDVFGSLPQRQTYYLQQQPQQQQQQQYQQPQQQYQQPQQQQYQQQQQPLQPDYLLSTQHRQHPSAVSSQYTSHQAVSSASPGFGTGQATSVFGGRDPASATPRPQAPSASTHTPTAPSSGGSVTFHGSIRDQAAYLSAASLVSPSQTQGQSHRFETRRPPATASLGGYSPGPAPTAATQSAVSLFHQQAHTPSYAEIPVGTSSGVVGYTLGVAADDGATTGSQLETPAQRAHHYLQVQQQQQQQQQQPAQTFLQQPNSVQRPEGPSTSDKPARKRRPPAAQKKPTAAEEARRPPQPPPRQQDPYFLQQQQQQQQYQPEVQQNTPQHQQPVSWPPTAPQRQVPSAPEASRQQEATYQQGTPSGQRHGARRRPPQAEASTHTPTQYQEEPGPRTTPRQHARRPPHRQQFGPSAQAPTSSPQLEQPTAQGEYRPHRRRRPTQTQQEQPAVTAPGQQYSAPQQEAAIRQQQAFYQNTAASENGPTAPGAVGEIPSAPSAPASADAQPPRQYIRRRPQNKQKYHITMDNDKRTGGSNDWEQAQNTVKPARPHTRRPVQEQNTEVNFATEQNTGNGNTYSQPQLTAPEGRPQQRRRPGRPQHRNPPATLLNTYPVTENYPPTQKDEETYTNAVVRPEETPSEDAPPVPEQVQNQQVYTRRPSTRYSTTESVTEAATDFQDEEQSGQRTRVRQQQRRPSTRYSTTESVTEAATDSQDEEQPAQRTRVRQQHVSRRPAQPTVEKEMTTVIHYRRPLHPSRRPLYKKGAARPIRPPPEYESDSAGQQEATNEPVSLSDNSGDYVQDYRLAESKKVQRQRYKRPQVSPDLAEDVPVRTAAVDSTAYQLQSNSPLDAEDNYALDEPIVPAPAQKVRQRVNQQGLTRGKNKYHREPPAETDTPLPEPTEQLYVETPVQTEPDLENDVLGGGADARFPSAVDYTPEEEEEDSEPPATTPPSTTTTSTTTTTTTTTTTPAPATTRPPSTLEKLRQRSRYNATRPRFSVRDFQERLHRISTSTAAPDPEASDATQPAAPASRYSGRQRSTTTTSPEDQEAARPRPIARDPARVNSARYRASTPATTTAVTPSTRYKYKSRYRSTFSTSTTTTEEPTTATTTVSTPTPSALVSRPSLRTKGIFSAVRPNPLLRMSSTLGTTTTTTTTTTTPPPPPTSSVAAEFTNEADEPTAPSAPSAPGVFGVRTAEPSPTVDDELSQSQRIAELTLAAGARAPSSVSTSSYTATSQSPQHTTDLLSAYWAQQDSSVSPSISTNPSPHYTPITEEDDQPSSATTPDASPYPSTAADSVADQSATSQVWSDDAVPPTQMITDLTSSASPSDFFHKSMTSKHSLRITMATDDPILPLEAFFPSWGGKEDNNRR